MIQVFMCTNSGFFPSPCIFKRSAGSEPTSSILNLRYAQYSLTKESICLTLGLFYVNNLSLCGEKEVYDISPKNIKHTNKSGFSLLQFPCILYYFLTLNFNDDKK